MANKFGRDDLAQEYNNNFPDNNSKFITAALLRDFMESINLSKFNLTDDDINSILINKDNPNEGTLNQLITSIVNSSGNIPLFYIDFNFNDNTITTNYPGSSISITSYKTRDPTGPDSPKIVGRKLLFSYPDTQVSMSRSVGYVTINHSPAPSGYSSSFEINDGTGYSVTEITNTSSEIITMIPGNEPFLGNGDENTYIIDGGIVRFTAFSNPNSYLIES